MKKKIIGELSNLFKGKQKSKGKKALRDPVLYTEQCCE